MNKNNKKKEPARGGGKRKWGRFPFRFRSTKPTNKNGRTFTDRSLIFYYYCYYYYYYYYYYFYYYRFRTLNDRVESILSEIESMKSLKIDL